MAAIPGSIIDALIGFAAPVGGVAGWYLRDRRKSRAEAEVAERTVGFDVELKDAAARDRRLSYVEHTFGLERESLNRQIVDLRAENTTLRTELTSREELVERLRAQASHMEQQLSILTQQTHHLQEQLETLTRPNPDPLGQEPR